MVLCCPVITEEGIAHKVNMINNVMYCSAQAKHANSQNAFFAYSISHQALLSCLRNKLAEKLLQSSFCDQTQYITNVYRVISRFTKVALLNNFRTES